MLLNTDTKSEQIQQIQIISSDISAIKIATNSGSMIIINIYNGNLNTNTIGTLAREWETREDAWLSPYPTELFILGLQPTLQCLGRYRQRPSKKH